ncbi:MAG TPA: hypothetical protein VEV17_12220 [Bryobacteraceae bacterium]|nr:hypothetical protein [Bryobacteraceae bacterium]
MRFRWPLVLCLLASASAQQYTISTVAGIGRMQFAGAGQPAVKARVIEPWGVAADASGNVYFSDQYYLQVFRIDPNGIVTVYAGSGQSGSGGDSGPATAAQFRVPGFLATDPGGDLYIADSGNGNVRKVTPDGTITTVATGGGDGVAVDSKGNLYVSGGNAIHIVRPDGTNSVIAGTGKPGYTGDKGQAVNALLSAPRGLRVDASGNIFVAEWANNVIREINAQGVITTFAGNGKSGSGGNGGLATAANLRQPSDVLLDGNGNLYIADTFQVRIVDKTGKINLFAGGAYPRPTASSPIWPT